MDNKKNEKVYKDYYLFLDSIHRSHGSNVSYQCNFNDIPDEGQILHNRNITHGAYRNVVSVELRGVSIKNIPDQAYVILQIDELEGRLHSNVPQIDQSFAMLYFDHVTDENNLYTKPIRGSDMDTKIVYFDPPISKLSRLHIRFYSSKTITHSNGEVEAYLDAKENEYFNSILLKITTIINQKIT
jgi:hypothetical protein